MTGTLAAPFPWFGGKSCGPDSCDEVMREENEMKKTKPEKTAPTATAAALAEFAARWDRLPPLVRAAMAEKKALDAWQDSALLREKERVLSDIGMTRRAQVCEAFSEANLMVSDLFRALSVDADALAVAGGIGPLTGTDDSGAP